MVRQSDPERSMRLGTNDNILKATVTILMEETLVDKFL